MTAWAKAYSLHTGLKEVRMVQNGIRQEGISHLLTDGLSHINGLQVLDLQDNTFTIMGSRALAKVTPGWSNLAELGVGDSLLGAKGGILVAEALGKGENKKLETLRLQYNDINAKGLGVFALAAKESLPALQKIELNGNKFSEDDISIMKLRELLDERKEASKEAMEDDWGLDSLSDLDDDDDDEEDEEEEELREKLIEDAEEAQEEPVIQKNDKDVDDLAIFLSKAEITEV